MKSNFTHYYYMISCPSDVSDQINLILETINKVNHEIGEQNSIYLVPLYWKNDAIPSTGDSAQGIINKQLLLRADGLIALFWTRFGTPTDLYSSGTEEEIIKAIHDKKDVVLLFCEKEINPKKIDVEQYQKVNRFKNDYYNMGMFATYDSDNKLVEELRRILTSIIFTLANRKSTDQNRQTMSNKEKETYPLAEYFELGWFLRRSYLEIPLASMSMQERITFIDRMSMLSFLIHHYDILERNEYDALVKFNDCVSSSGLQGYIEEHGKDSFEMIQEIFTICELALRKKLIKKASAAFQMGNAFGQYLQTIQVQWIEKMREYKLREIIEYTETERTETFRQLMIASQHIDKSFSDRIKYRWNDCHENEDITLEDYNNKLGNLAEQITHELQLYS